LGGLGLKSLGTWDAAKVSDRLYLSPERDTVHSSGRLSCSYLVSLQNIAKKVCEDVSREHPRLPAGDLFSKGASHLTGTLNGHEPQARTEVPVHRSLPLGVSTASCWYAKLLTDHLVGPFHSSEEGCYRPLLFFVDRGRMLHMSFTKGVNPQCEIEGKIPCEGKSVPDSYVSSDQEL
jgi:hypothetical protein